MIDSFQIDSVSDEPEYQASVHAGPREGFIPIEWLNWDQEVGAMEEEDHTEPEFAQHSPSGVHCVNCFESWGDFSDRATNGSSWGPLLLIPLVT